MNVEVTWGNLELAITNANRQNLDLQPLTAGKECLIIATSLGAVPVVGISKKAWWKIISFSCQWKLIILNTLMVIFDIPELWLLDWLILILMTTDEVYTGAVQV